MTSSEYKFGKVIKSNTILSASSAKRKAPYPISNIQINCHVNDTELSMDFDYFPSSAQLQQVVCFLMDGAAEENPEPPLAIDATITEPYFTDTAGPVPHPWTAEDSSEEFFESESEEECDHQRVKCGKFYGSVCADTSPLEHTHIIMETCGYCLFPKPHVSTTGNAAGFICSDCCLEDRREGKACNFCTDCTDYLDLDSNNRCEPCATFQSVWEKGLTVMPNFEDDVVNV